MAIGALAALLIEVIPPAIKAAETIWKSKPKSGREKNDFVVNTVGAAIDNVGKQGLVVPQQVAPVLSEIVELVFKMLDKNGEVNNNVDWGAKAGQKVIFEGVIRNA